LSEDGTTLIRDWLVLEEAPAVNIIVQTLEGKRFVVFQQKKYAIPGETLSPVGGFIDLGESPLVAAQREVLEELGLGSRQTLELVQSQGESVENISVLEISKIITENAMPAAVDEFGLLIDQSSSKVTTTQADSDSDWIFLGRYRTAANRGGGYLYSYLLINAVPLLSGGGTSTYVGGTGDYESQTILHLTKAEVIEALSEGKFQEVKWAASFALAILHLKEGMAAQ
jgi:8-oxo-dGTP pyrophosphatase MutT (NUDIX family)